MTGTCQIAVDVGGTFTDVVAVRDGRIETIKVPTDLADSARGVLTGLAEIGVADASVFNHASTAGLNAVLTRQLPKVALLCTAGHRDILDIGRNWRPAEAVSDPRWRRSFSDVARPLVPRYLRRGVRERSMPDGAVFLPLDETQARKQIRVLGRCAVEGVAIALMHAYVAPAHEQRLRALVREELGEIPCAVSSEVGATRTRTRGTQFHRPLALRGLCRDARAGRDGDGAPVTDHFFRSCRRHVRLGAFRHVH